MYDKVGSMKVDNYWTIEKGWIRVENFANNYKVTLGRFELKVWHLELWSSRLSRLLPTIQLGW